MGSGDARIVVTVDLASGELKKIQDFDKALEQMGQSAQGTSTQANWLEKAVGSLAGQFTLASVAAGLINRGLSDLKGFFDSCVKGAMEAEATEHRLAVALEMTGQAGLGTYHRLVDFSKAEQNATVYSDEQVRSTMALMEQMVHLDERGLKKATQGIEGLASVMGVDLETAARRVMMAMEGNAAGLSRYGIHLDATLPKEQQHAQLLDQLISLYPRATAELETTSGKLAQNKNLWGELKENLGKVISDLLDIPGTLKSVNDLLKTYNKNVDDNAHSTSAARLQMSMMYGYVSAFIPQQEYVNMAWHNQSEILKGVASDIVHYVTSMDFAIKANHALRASLDAAAGGLPEMKKMLDTIAESQKKFEAKWEVSWVDQLKLDEVEAGFKGVDAAIDDTDTAMDILNKNIEGSAPDWDKLIEKQKEEERQYQSLAREFVVWGDTNKSILATVGQAWADLTKKIIMNLEAQVLAEELKTAKLIALKKDETLANYIASLFDTMPWFIALPLTITAFAAINALFAKVLKFSGGFEGVVRQPTLFLAGEAGPERVSVRNQTQMNNSTSTINVAIYSSGVVDGNKVWKEIQYQAQRRGIKIGRA